MYGFRLRLSITRLRFIIPACAVLSAAGFVQSAVPEKSTAPQLTITSQSMTAQGKERKAFFEGAVVLTQKELIIHSDHMVVTFKREENGTKRESEQGGFGQKIESAEATGNVVIEKSSGKATCGRALYFKAEEKVVLMESPVACQNGTRVTGTRMTMFLNEDRMLVEGGSRVIIPEGEEDLCAQ